MTRSGFLLLASLSLPLAACTDADTPTPEASASGLAAPTWVMTGPGGTFSLADAAGRPVVLQFGPSDDGTWDGLREAHLDLEAAGALVVGAVTDEHVGSLRLPFATVADPGAEIAELYGYAGRPLVVVIDAEGRLRSRSEDVTTTDQFFNLAASALLEVDEVDMPMASASESRDPKPLAPEAVAGKVRDGAALFDLRSAQEQSADGAIPNAYICSLEDFAPDVLPVNALTPVILAGPDAPEAATWAVEWGFQTVYVVQDASPLADPDAEPFAPEVDEPESRLPNRRRAIG
ncbi:redoxin domain-containing protein [Rubricoccus marinus]|uniref:Alkyl hydroperoxide reductase subunit C/ Thiol specific antioxidant domain-containing protein n=1 Tax=Rubricoccus marinus TaxID=716817 RepID=A0A259TYM2_9BACT|nr:redoxin domain-containing protein [Rubricoccus marinus]OZC02849.1 hypothetical protein BSZ36_07610 [Rubricoccus marinus]